MFNLIGLIKNLTVWSVYIQPVIYVSVKIRGVSFVLALLSGSSLIDAHTFCALASLVGVIGCVDL